MLKKCVDETKLGGGRGAGLDRENKPKEFGEIGKTSRELEHDIWLRNNMKECGEQR